MQLIRAGLQYSEYWRNSFCLCIVSSPTISVEYKAIFTRFLKSLPIIVQLCVQAKSLCKPIKGDLALKKTLPLPRFKLTRYLLTYLQSLPQWPPITFCSRPSWPLKDCRFSGGPCCGLQQADPAMARPFPEPMRHIRLLFTSVNFWVILAGQGLNQASLNLMEKFHSVWLHFELSLCAPASISLVNLFLL